MTTTPLAPCPFCGSKKVSVKGEEVPSYRTDYYYFVLCKDCGAQGPSQDAEDFGYGHLAARKAAKKAWNERKVKP